MAIPLLLQFLVQLNAQQEKQASHATDFGQMYLLQEMDRATIPLYQVSLMPYSLDFLVLIRIEIFSDPD